MLALCLLTFDLKLLKVLVLEQANHPVNFEVSVTSESFNIEWKKTFNNIDLCDPDIDSDQQDHLT